MAKNIDLPDGSTGLVIVSIDKDGNLQLNSLGDGVVTTSTEITKMALTPGDDDKAGAKGAKITEDGRYQLIKLSAGVNTLGANGAIGDRLEEIIILGGMTVAGAPVGSGSIIANDNSVEKFLFDLQTVKTDLGPIEVLEIKQVSTGGGWDIEVEGSVLGATGGRIYARGRFTD